MKMFKRRRTSTIILFFKVVLLTSTAAATTNTWFDNGDGTVTDRATGRVWQQQGGSFNQNHAAAVVYCLNLELAGSDDWLLPNIKQLTSIVDYRKSLPAVDQTAFTNTLTSSYYWSSSNRSMILGAEFWWVVDFREGAVRSTNGELNNRVRCIKSSSESSGP